MSEFIEGEDRSQGTLLPERLDDYVAEDNPVLVIDVFIDVLLRSDKLVAIDGSKFKAVNSRGSGVVGHNVQSAVDSRYHR
jgi:transposase